LFRGIQHAQRHFGAHVVYFDLQSTSDAATKSLDEFLRTIAEWFIDELDHDPMLVEATWNSRLPAQRKLTKLIERHILPAVPEPILLAMDEIDQLQHTPYHTDFFGLIRSWHNRRASNPIWNRLTTIMAISTEPYLLIDNLNQSPFNVGQILHIKDFNESQVADLNRRYGTPVSSRDLPRMMELLNGHPYLTRVALYTMVADKLTWGELESMAVSDQGPFYQHLQWQHRLIVKNQRLREALKEIIHSCRSSDETACFRLMKAGLVTKVGNNGYDCRCGLHRRYFASRL
jgi:hypothetical protein